MSDIELSDNKIEPTSSDSAFSGLMSSSQISVSVKRQTESDKNSIHNYFNYNGESKKSKCKNCSIGHKGKHKTNLVRHLRKHNDIYKILSKVKLNCHSKS